MYVPLRKKELGRIKFEKDERYDPKRNWRYPYGKQLVEIRKPKSHEFGERKWKAIYTKDLQSRTRWVYSASLKP